MHKIMSSVFIRDDTRLLHRTNGCQKQKYYEMLQIIFCGKCDILKQNNKLVWRKQVWISFGKYDAGWCNQLVFQAAN